MILAFMIAASSVLSLNGDSWMLDGKPVSVPHTWNAEDYDMGFADGLGVDDFRLKIDPGNSVKRCATLMKVATYTRPLPAPEDGRRYFVRFDGVCEKAVVRVNGRFAGSHVGASDRYEGVRPGVNDKGLVTADRKILKDSYFFYKANWSSAPVFHLCSKRMETTTNSVCDVMVFSNLHAPVRLTVNGEKRGERMPDEVVTVEFKSVGLRPGENEISVECGDFAEKWRIKRIQ